MAARTRLRRVRAATARIKDSGMAVGADTIIGLGAFAPPALHATAARPGRAGALVQRRRLQHPGAAGASLHLAGARSRRATRR